MKTERRESMELRTPDSIVWFRQRVREWAVQTGFGLVDQTKLVTAASELARNTVDHGGGGVAHLEMVSNGTLKGLRFIFEDEGPGIPDVDQALSDGYSSTGGWALAWAAAGAWSMNLKLRAARIAARGLWLSSGNERRCVTG